jgi:CheY-like chemotaxis protein/HPt (histidine-containing phosphotransfer) domain-containing protein
VEDGLVNQQVASRLLEARGHHVSIAGNGIEALEALRGHSFDLILMDVQMPEMDGYEATRAIRRDEQQTGAHVPIIAMTAHAMKGDREHCLAAGMDAYLSKPIHAKILYETVEGMVATGVQREQAPAEEMDTTGVLDWEAAVQRVGGRTDLLQQMVSLFFKECDKRLPEIRAAIHDRNTAQLRRVAHSLKGSADCFAAHPAVEAALRLELMGKHNDLTDAEEASAELEAEIARLKLALTAYTV